MTFAAETNATRQQSLLGGQRGPCSRGAADDRQTDTHTDTQTPSGDEILLKESEEHIVHVETMLNTAMLNTTAIRPTQII